MADYLILLEYQIKAWGFEIQAKRQSVYNVFSLDVRKIPPITNPASCASIIYDSIWYVLYVQFTVLVSFGPHKLLKFVRYRFTIQG